MADAVGTVTLLEDRNWGRWPGDRLGGEAGTVMKYPGRVFLAAPPQIDRYSPSAVDNGPRLKEASLSLDDGGVVSVGSHRGR